MCLGTDLKEFFSDSQDTQIIPNAQKNMMEPIRLSLFPGGSTYPDNPHDGEEFGYIISGSATLHLGKKTYKVKKGETFYFTANKTHFLSADNKTGVVLIWVSTIPIRRYHMNKILIDLKNINKTYDGQMVLDDLNLYIRENEFLTLLGPSGCGKTTTLRILGGFEMPDTGKVIFDGTDITKLPPNKRQLNTVFQKYALFTHMTIAENIAFGLKIKNKSQSYIDDKIKYALKLVNLDGYEKRMPDSLSGGQQQRIAIARAIVNEPKVLLLDEPLGALDLKLRQDMQYELIRLKNELGITFIYVTHDQEEALTMSDTIVVMNQGYIQQIGTPEKIYNEPENAFVADFIGDSNIISSIMIEDKLVDILGTRFPCVDTGFGCNKPVDVVIRPEDVILSDPGCGKINGVVTHLIFKGVHYEMEVTAAGYEWLVHSTSMFPVGTKVGINVDPFNIQIMNKPASEDEEAVGINE